MHIPVPLRATLVAAVASLALAAPAAAHTFTVTNIENEGAGSLREAVKAANEAPGADTIAFAAGIAGTIQLAGSGLTLKESVTIEGPGAGQVTVEQTAKGEHRVFAVAEFSAPGAVAFSGLHIAGGRWADGGGDIYNEDSNAALTIERCLLTGGRIEETHGNGGAVNAEGQPLIVRDSTFSGNEAASGGALWAGGEDGDTVTIEDSTFSGNVAEDDAGAVLIEVQEGGTSQIVDSTFSGNRSGEGGGALYADAGDGSPLRIVNSTFAGNQAGDRGGAMVLDAEDLAVTIEGSTIAGNRVTEPGGVAGGIQAYTIQPLLDTIVAGNSAASEPDLSGKALASFDLFGNPAGAEVTELVPGSDLLGVDPQLGPLADNGGPTETMALPPGSPAVNKGGGVLATDQRGDARPVIYPGVALSGAPGANGADIGAYELQAPAATGGPLAPPVAPPPPAAPKASPRVRVSCPKGTRPDGCRFALQVVAARPHKAKGKGHRAKPPRAESAVARARLKADRSTLLTLTPKPRFAAKLDAAKKLLVREVTTVEGHTRTSYRQLKVVG